MLLVSEQEHRQSDDAGCREAMMAEVDELLYIPERSKKGSELAGTADPNDPR